MKSPGGFVWATKNYDGDVQSDTLAQGKNDRIIGYKWITKILGGLGHKKKSIMRTIPYNFHTVCVRLCDRNNYCMSILQPATQWIRDFMWNINWLNKKELNKWGCF